MSTSPIALSRMTRWPRVAATQCWHRLGAPGCAGLTLWIASAGLAYAVYQLHGQTLDARPISAATPISAQEVATPGLPRPRLPSSTDVPQVLRLLQLASQEAGLGWSQADYRVNPLTDEGLATLEVRTTLKGPYPALRKWITTLLDTQPALALRELALTRPNSDTLEVEAKITLAVFLSDGWPIAAPPEWPALDKAGPDGSPSKEHAQPTAHTVVVAHPLPALSPRPSTSSSLSPPPGPTNSKGARP